MIATLRFTLPDEQAEYDSARLGSEARQTLWQIDQRLRSLMKYGAPCGETRILCDELRAMIPAELLDI
jgi:hypothetical protein